MVVGGPESCGRAYGHRVRWRGLPSCGDLAGRPARIVGPYLRFHRPSTISIELLHRTQPKFNLRFHESQLLAWTLESFQSGLHISLSVGDRVALLGMMWSLAQFSPAPLPDPTHLPAPVTTALGTARQILDRSCGLPKDLSRKISAATSRRKSSSVNPSQSSGSSRLVYSPFLVGTRRLMDAGQARAEAVVRTLLAFAEKHAEILGPVWYIIVRAVAYADSDTNHIRRRPSAASAASVSAASVSASTAVPTLKAVATPRSRTASVSSPQSRYWPADRFAATSTCPESERSTRSDSPVASRAVGLVGGPHPQLIH